MGIKKYCIFFLNFLFLILSLGCLRFEESDLDPNSPLSILINLDRLINLPNSNPNQCLSTPDWKSFIGTISQTGRFSFPTNFLVNKNSDFFAFQQTTFNFGPSGLNYQGADGTTNFYLSKFSGSGSPIWNRYIGRRSDRPTELINSVDNGLYVLYTVSDTDGAALPINTIIPYPTAAGARTVLIKISDTGEFQWTRPYTNGADGDSIVTAFHLIESLDKTKLYILGSSSSPLTGPGSVIGPATGDNWFIQTVGFDGIASSTRYIPLPAGSRPNLRPIRFIEIPNNGGYYIISFVETDINITSQYPNELSPYPSTFGTYMVMKFNSDWVYQWHRHLGINPIVNASDGNFPLALTLTDGSLLTSSIYNAATDATLQPYTGAGEPSTILFHISPTGALLNSSFLYKTNGEVVNVTSARIFRDNKIYITGLVGPELSSNGFISDLSLSNLSEGTRLVRPESFIAGMEELCDGGIGTVGYASGDVDSSPIPFGSGIANTIFSRFKR